MNVVFKVADDRGLLLIDLKDLKSMVKYVSDNSKELQTTYGKFHLKAQVLFREIF